MPSVRNRKSGAPTIRAAPLKPQRVYEGTQVVCTTASSQHKTLPSPELYGLEAGRSSCRPRRILQTEFPWQFEETGQVGRFLAAAPRIPSPLATTARRAYP